MDLLDIISEYYMYYQKISLNIVRASDAYLLQLYMGDSLTKIEKYKTSPSESVIEQFILSVIGDTVKRDVREFTSRSLDITFNLNKHGSTCISFEQDSINLTICCNREDLLKVLRKVKTVLNQIYQNTKPNKTCNYILTQENEICGPGAGPLAADAVIWPNGHIDWYDKDNDFYISQQVPNGTVFTHSTSHEQIVIHDKKVLFIQSSSLQTEEKLKLENELKALQDKIKEVEQKLKTK
jgi:hypothetical protein